VKTALINRPPKPPATLRGPARKLWQSIQSDYGIIDSGGLVVLDTACEAYARMKQAKATLDTEGLTMRDARDQLKPHPCIKIEADNRAQFLTALKTLNLDLEPLQQAAGRPGGSGLGKISLVRN
jgi:P27 family predicted phage terminase small subunit